MDEGSTRFEEGCLNDALALELILFDDFGEARDFPMIGGSSKREQTNNGGPSVHLAERESFKKRMHLAEREFQEEKRQSRKANPFCRILTFIVRRGLWVRCLGHHYDIGPP
jgi:hypothetical protein